jgi:hypothetical protein
MNIGKTPTIQIRLDQILLRDLCTGQTGSGDSIAQQAKVLTMDEALLGADPASTGLFRQAGARLLCYIIRMIFARAGCTPDACRTSGSVHAADQAGRE